MAKVRESGMPEEFLWQTFFSPESVLQALGLVETDEVVVDFGCGFGTFALPAAQATGGIVHAFDIDPSMIATTKAKATQLSRGQVELHLYDFMAAPCELPDGSADYVMLFNILHTDEPQRLLREAWRLLRPNGRVGVMHWNFDPDTPRGPPMDIRPRPEQIKTWIESEGFSLFGEQIDLPPYHYGFIGIKAG